MKAQRSWIGWAAAVALVWGCGGCTGPRLASQPLNEQQLEWASIIRTSYRGWRPPNFPTVTAGDPRIEVVPEVAVPGWSMPLPVAPPAGGR